MMPEEIIIDCPDCGVRIAGKPRGSVIIGDDWDQTGFFLVQCSTCKNPLFGKADIIGDDFNNIHWDVAERLWPNPKRAELGDTVPEAIKKDVRDAHKSITHGIYSAAAVLCGRALERVIRDKTAEKMLAKGLQELQKKGIIDRRLSEWADALRKERNIGAHATEEEISKENAEDVLDFTIAICDYIYTLHDKYEKYMERKKKKPE